MNNPNKNGSLADRIKEFYGDGKGIRRVLESISPEIIEPLNIELGARSDGKKIEIYPKNIDERVTGVFILPRYIQLDNDHPIIVSNDVGFTRFFNKSGEMILIYYTRKKY